ncbi:hypothetical protein ACFLSJ_06105 [Verrucomicrobiota bacterium]
MKSMFLLSSTAGVAAAAVLAFALCGCETESTAEGPRVSPGSVTIARGQSVQFSASGGFNYMWRLANWDWGTLSSLQGDTTVYTSIYEPSGSHQVQTLTLTSTIEVTPGTNTSYARTAEAHITHVAPDLLVGSGTATN